MKTAKTVFSNIAISIISISALTAQDFSKAYFNSNWTLTNKENATYYRKSGFNSNLPAYDSTVTDYYNANGQMEMIGSYPNGLKTGIFSFYYPTGQIKMSANYRGNERVGNWKEFYSNGVLKISVEYVDDSEKLIELNDSLGNSLIVNDKIAYNLTYPYVPLRYASSDIIENDDVQFVSGKIINTMRDGKWTISRDEGKEIYATLKYKMGNLESGFVYINNQKVELFNNLAFPLILDPFKFTITESFMPEPGVKIRNNYVTEGLHEHSYKSMEKVTIATYDELCQYVDRHFDLRSNKSENIIKISLIVLNGKITDFTTDSKISTNSEKGLWLVFDTIEMIEFKTENPVVIEYKVKLENSIGED